MVGADIQANLNTKLFQVKSVSLYDSGEVLHSRSIVFSVCFCINAKL